MFDMGILALQGGGERANNEAESRTRDEKAVPSVGAVTGRFMAVPETERALANGKASGDEGEERTRTIIKKKS